MVYYLSPAPDNKDWCWKDFLQSKAVTDSSPRKTLHLREPWKQTKPSVFISPGHTKICLSQFTLLGIRLGFRRVLRCLLRQIYKTQWFSALVQYLLSFISQFLFQNNWLLISLCIWLMFVISFTTLHLFIANASASDQWLVLSQFPGYPQPCWLSVMSLTTPCCFCSASYRFPQDLLIFSCNSHTLWK